MLIFGRSEYSILRMYIVQSTKLAEENPIKLFYQSTDMNKKVLQFDMNASRKRNGSLTALYKKYYISQYYK